MKPLLLVFALIVLSCGKEPEPPNKLITIPWGDGDTAWYLPGDIAHLRKYFTDTVVIHDTVFIPIPDKELPRQAFELGWNMGYMAGIKGMAYKSTYKKDSLFNNNILSTP